MENDFVRGWDVFRERTLDLMTTGYQEITAYLVRVAELLKQGQDAHYQAAMLVEVDRILFEKRVLAIRALGNISESMHAYYNAYPLLTYKATPDRLYDMTYITPFVVRCSEYIDSEYFEKLYERTDSFFNLTERLDDLMQQGKNGTIDISKLRVLNEDFEAVVRSYNYYKYLLEERVIPAPVEYADEAIKRFEDLNNTMMDRYEDFQRKYNSLVVFLNDVTSAWSRVQEVRFMADLYLNDTSRTKTELAERITSKQIRKDVDTINAFLSKVATESHELTESFEVFERSYAEMWNNILSEASLDGFYQAVNEHLNMARNNGTWLEYWKSKAAYMLDFKSSWVASNLDTVEKLMNADFVSLTIESKAGDIEAISASLLPLFDVSESVVTGQTFLKAMSDITASMEAYLEGSILSTDYYRYIYQNVGSI